MAIDRLKQPLSIIFEAVMGCGAVVGWKSAMSQQNKKSPLHDKSYRVISQMKFSASISIFFIRVMGFQIPKT